jgi:hypothetical protein
MKQETDLFDIASWIVHVGLLINLLGSGICWAFGIVGWMWPAISATLFLAVWGATLCMCMLGGAIAGSCASLVSFKPKK